jgi:hypothetical protein
VVPGRQVGARHHRRRDPINTARLWITSQALRACEKMDKESFSAVFD